MQSRVANAVRATVLKDGTQDTGCGLKAFRRDLFLSLPYFDGLHRFLPALVRREGFEIGIIDLFGVWWLIRRKKRIAQPVEVTLAR